MAVIRIIFLYVKVSYIVKFVPLRKYYHKFFSHGDAQSLDLSKHRDKIRLIKKMMSILPGMHTCLKECIVVHLYFRKYDIYVPIYIGVNTSNGFLAHAWYETYETNFQI